MKDQDLEKKLLALLDKLERRIDYVGPTPLRRELDAHLVGMRQAIKNFDQEEYETCLSI